MRSNTGSRALAFTILLVSGPAAAQNYDWATCDPAVVKATTCTGAVQTCCTLTFANTGPTRPVVIPMDRCHQQYENGDAPGVGAPGTANGAAWCSDPNPYNANGLFHAYGLIYRLMQNGIPVYWVVNPTKHATSVTNYTYTPASGQLLNAEATDMWLLSANTSPPAKTGSLTACGAGCTPPVLRLDTTTMATIAGTYTKKEFPIRGSAFMIDSADRANFDKFMLHQSPYPALSGRGCGQSGNDCYNFTAVAMYEIQSGTTYAWQDYTLGLTGGFFSKSDNIPIAVKIDYKPPRVARLGSTSSVATGWLEAANLNDPATNATCGVSTFSPSDAVYCNVSESLIISNGLVTGGFSWAWIDKQSFTSCGKAMQKIKAFMKTVPATWEGSHVMFNETGIENAEECDNHQILGNPGLSSTTGGLLLENSAVNETATQPMIVRYPTNLFLQYGDLPLDFASGAVTYWTTNASHNWNSAFNTGTNTLRRLVTQERTRVGGTNRICGDNNDDGDVSDAGEYPHSTTAAVSGVPCDYNPTPSNANADAIEVATYGRFLNDAMNGIAFYTPGNQIRNKAAELRIVLNSLIATPSTTAQFPPTSTFEVTRASPVTAQVGGANVLVQGVYTHYTPVSAPYTALVDGDVDTFVFPYRTGHLKYINADTTTNLTLASASNLEKIPASTNTLAGGCTFPKTSTNANCRTIFTNVASGAKPTLTYFTTANATAIGAIINDGTSLSSTSQQTIMSKVVAGGMGGISRSTAAVIEASSVIANGRPKIAYVGAHDGMLHAFCAEVNAAKGCDVLGRELWAFLPRTELPLIKSNQQRIDGSPRVVDIYDDFGSGKQWKTVLMFQTGTGDYVSSNRVPAVYALDVSDPTSPSILWEYSQTANATMPSVALGRGLTIAAGRITSGTTTKNIAWIQTNNGGSGGTGVVVYAINIATGATYWTSPFSQIYSPNPRTSANDPVVGSAIPGGAVPVDRTGNNLVTDIVFTTPYGSLWMLDAATGTSQNGIGKSLWRASSDFRPVGAKPAIFETAGSTYATFATGGYADPSDTSWPMECKNTAAGATNVCSQYNNSTTALPIQYALAVKLTTTGSFPLAEPVIACGSPIACVDSNFKFRKDLAQDEKSYSQPLVIGEEVFFTTDMENVNRNDYGTTGTNQGRLYAFTTSGAASGSPIAIVNGSTSATNLGQSVFTGAGTKVAYQQTSVAAPGAGNAVTIIGASGGVSRKLWLRSE